MAPDGSGWVEDRPGSDAPAPTAGWVADPSADLPDLTTFAGVTVLRGPDVPADLVAHTSLNGYRVRGYYQVDDVSRWREWKRARDQAGGQETWLFYACPSSLIAAVLRRRQVHPYGEFFPRVFGEKAIYFFAQATPAARAALRFGLDEEGFLISCRVVTGRVFRTRRANPGGTQMPAGYDAVKAPQGTDLGNGPLDCDLYAVLDPQQVLMRYVTHVVRPHGH